MWQPSTVEEIRAWMLGEYVPNPTAEEYAAQLRERFRALRASGVIPSMCLVPISHPSRNANDNTPKS